MSTPQHDLFGLSKIRYRYRGKFVGAVVMAILTALSTLLPLVTLNYLFRNLGHPSVERTVIFLFACILIPVLCHGLTSVFCHSLAFSVVHDLRALLLDVIPGLAPDYVTCHAASLKKLAVDDLAEFETAIAHIFPDIVISLVTMAVSTVFLAIISPWMALASLGLLPFAGWAWLQIGHVSAENGKAWHRADLRINRNLMAYIEGLSTLKAFNRPASSLPQLSSALKEISDLARNMTRQSLGSYVLLFICLGTNLIIVLPCGIFLHASHGLSLPDTLFSILLGMGLTVPFQRMMFASGTISRLRAIGHRFNALEVGEDIVTFSGSASDWSAFSLLQAACDVVFEDVSFSRSGEKGEVLSEISMTCRSGEVSAIIGSSGAGKSTLLQLACGVLAPTVGRVLVGGHDIATLPPDIMGRIFCPVFQKTCLLGQTLADNLKLCCPGITEAAIIAALCASGLSDCLTRFGLNGSIGRNGARLSGGERQRLAIARVMVSKAPVVLLDEPTAFVDSERELHLQQALARSLQGRTVLVVAHRLVTIRDAAQIAVLEGGRLTALGSHGHLLETSVLYASYAEQQFSSGAMISGAGT